MVTLFHRSISIIIDHIFSPLMRKTDRLHHSKRIPTSCWQNISFGCLYQGDLAVPMIRDQSAFKGELTCQHGATCD